MLFPHSWIATRPFCYVNWYRAIVSSRHNYCNALLAGMSESNLDKLQYIQNTLARIVTGLRRRDHITPALKELHLLPIRARITFKVVTVVYRLRERRQPPYLADLISDYVPTRTLRSSTKTLLAESSFRTNIGRRSFRYVAAKTSRWHKNSWLYKLISKRLKNIFI